MNLLQSYVEERIHLTTKQLEISAMMLKNVNSVTIKKCSQNITLIACLHSEVCEVIINIPTTSPQQTSLNYTPTSKQVHLVIRHNCRVLLDPGS